MTNGVRSAVTRRDNQFAVDAGSMANIASFGEDESGNLYILDLTGGEVFLVEGNPPVPVIVPAIDLLLD